MQEKLTGKERTALLYLAALESFGATVRTLSATEATLAGLCLAR